MNENNQKLTDGSSQTPTQKGVVDARPVENLEPSEPTSIYPKDKPKINIVLILSIILTLVIIFSAIGFYLYTESKAMEGIGLPKLNTSSPPSQTPKPNLIGEDWVVYKNDTYGISFEFPSDWSEGDGSIVGPAVKGTESSRFPRGLRPILTMTPFELDQADSDILIGHENTLNKIITTPKNKILIDLSTYIDGTSGEDWNKIKSVNEQIFNKIISTVKFSESSEGSETGCKIDGCSGELCRNASDASMASSCIYREEFACYKTAKCEKQTDGKCGWTMDSDLTSCLNSH